MRFDPLIVLLIILVFVFGVGGRFYNGGVYANYGYGGGGLLLLLLILFLCGVFEEICMITDLIFFLLGVGAGVGGAILYVHTHQAKALAAVASATTAVANLVSGTPVIKPAPVASAVPNPK